MPVEGLAAELVGEVVAVGLAGAVVQAEGVQRLPVLGELAAMVIGPLNRAERAIQSSIGAGLGR